MFLLARAAVLLVISTGTLVMANDLGNYCLAWRSAVPTACEDDQYETCPAYVEPSGDYDIDFEVYHGPPDAVQTENAVRKTNNNSAIRVRVRQYGTAYNTNIYFQNDAPDAAGCNASCEFADTPPGFCQVPPCDFSGECNGCSGTCDCHGDTCPGTNTPDCNSVDCDIMRNARTCGCEIEARMVELDIAGYSNAYDSQSCRLPTGQNEPNCDLDDTANPEFAWCNYLSPSRINGGIHFTIEALNLDLSRVSWKKKNGVTSVLPNTSPKTAKGELRHVEEYHV